MIIMKESMQSLMLTMRFNGLVLSTGTGFVVKTANGMALITNRHNVTGRHQQTGETLSETKAIPNEIVIYHPQSFGALPFIPRWESKVEALYDDGTPEGTPLWVEHPKHGKEVDFILLPLTQVDGVQFLPYDMQAGQEISLLPAETVSVIGFPFGMTSSERLAIWATGFVASDPDINYNNLPLMLIDCRSRKGQSGSPVIAQRHGTIRTATAAMVAVNSPMHRFVGIYSGRIHEESDIGMVWKGSAIQELIDSLKPPIKLFKLWGA